MTPEQRAKGLYDRLFRLGQFRGSAVVTDPLEEIARVIRQAEDAKIGKLVVLLRATHQHIDNQFGEHDTSVEAMAAAGASGAIEELADRLERGMLGEKGVRNMTPHNLSDEQWCVLDLLMRAKQKGLDRISRSELLYAPKLPQSAAVRLTWAALTMPKDLMAWHGQQEFSITPAGVSLYNLRFGKGQEPATPSRIADAVICLPDMSARAH